MQIGTQNVPIWDFSCGELERAASAGGLRLSTLFPLVEAMPPSGQNSRRRNGAKAVDSCGKCGLLCKAHVVSAFNHLIRLPEVGHGTSISASGTLFLDSGLLYRSNFPAASSGDPGRALPGLFGA